MSEPVTAFRVVTRMGFVGQDGVALCATRHGPFIVHRTLESSDLWTVTHERSGMSAGSRYPDADAAMNAAREFAALQCWDFDDLQGYEDEVSKANRKRCGEILHRWENVT